MTPRRDHGLDALRTLAVAAMMAAHTARLVTTEARPEWLSGVLLYEPLIPSLFLFLVGVSLTHSLARARDRRDWLSRQGRRAVMLWMISALFFALEHGIRSPDMLTASGILANIAYAVAITGTLLVAPRKRLALTLALLAGAAAFVILDFGEIAVFAVNAGNAPFLPLWLFAIAGALCGLMSARLLTIASAITLGVGAFIALRAGLHDLFTAPLGRSDASRLLPAPLTGGEPLHVRYYNFRTPLVLFCLGAHMASLTALRRLLRDTPERLASHVFSIGRHALGAYILHLALLAALVVAGGPRPLHTPWQGNLVVVTVVGICLIWSIWRENRIRAKNIDTSR